MWVQKIGSIFFGLILTFVVFLPSAHAGTWNQMTRLKFNHPVEIPHATLPAGTYWFVLADSPANRDLVEIYSANWSKRYAALETVPTERTRSTSHTELTFAERPANKPEALLKWYYPGQLTGHEFIYSSRHEKEFARDAKEETGVKPLNTRS
ncbi:MAG: hypothetical protein WCF26_28485 [Candidatus Sulfotelmatobacter sp.]